MKIGMDLNTRIQRLFDNGDYTTYYFEMDILSEKTSDGVITRWKINFSRYELPLEIISDNGQQLTAEKFKQFAQEYNFTHETTSPRNSKANGRAEAAAKNMLIKCKINGEDPYIGLLNIRKRRTIPN